MSRLPAQRGHQAPGVEQQIERVGDADDEDVSTLHRAHRAPFAVVHRDRQSARLADAAQQQRVVVAVAQRGDASGPQLLRVILFQDVVPLVRFQYVWFQRDGGEFRVRRAKRVGRKHVDLHQLHQCAKPLGCSGSQLAAKRKRARIVRHDALDAQPSKSRHVDCDSRFRHPRSPHYRKFISARAYPTCAALA
jgi:hypothetical protein